MPICWKPESGLRSRHKAADTGERLSLLRSSGQARSFIHLDFCILSLMKTREAVDLQRSSGAKLLGHDKGKRRETRTGNCYSTVYPRPARCCVFRLRAELISVSLKIIPFWYDALD